MRAWDGTTLGAPSKGQQTETHTRFRVQGLGLGSGSRVQEVLHQLGGLYGGYLYGLLVLTGRAREVTTCAK